MSIGCSFNFPLFESPLNANLNLNDKQPRSPPPEKVIRNCNLHPRTMGLLDSTKKLCYAPNIKTALSKSKSKRVESDGDSGNAIYYRFLCLLGEYEGDSAARDQNKSVHEVVEEIILTINYVNQMFKNCAKLPKERTFDTLDPSYGDVDLIDFYNSFSSLVFYIKGYETFKSKSSIGYRVKHRLDGEWYYLKTGVISRLAEPGNVLNRSNSAIMREIKALSAIRHANIVTYFTSWFEQQSFNLQLEYFIGESLHYFLYSTNTRANNNLKKFPLTNKVSEQAAVAILRQIGSALCYLHEELQIVHNAVEPAHLMIYHKGYLSLVKGDNVEYVRSMIYQCLLATRQPQDIQFKLISFGHSFGEGDKPQHYESDYLPPVAEGKHSLGYWRRRDVHALGMTVIHAMCGGKRSLSSLATDAINFQDESLRDVLKAMIDPSREVTARCLLDL